MNNLLAGSCLLLTRKYQLLAAYFKPGAGTDHLKARICYLKATINDLPARTFELSARKSWLLARVIDLKARICCNKKPRTS